MTTPDVRGRLPGALVCASLLALAVLNAAALRTNDLEVFHTAGARASRGEALYRAEDGARPFKYAPVVALLLQPLGALPIRAAKAVWEVASALALFAFLRHAARLALPEPRPTTHAAVLVLLLPYLWHLLSLGQIDGLLLAAMAVSDRWSTRRPVLSGLLWALAVLTKPPYAVFLLVAVPSREWLRLLALAGGLLSGLLAGAAAWGWGANLRAHQAWAVLLGTSSAEIICDPPNQSIWALVCSYGPHPPGPGYLAAVAALALAVGAVAVWAARRVPAAARDTGASACFAATALASPLGWWANLTALAPLVYGVWGTLVSRERTAARLLALGAVLALAAVGVLTPELISRQTFTVFLEHRHYGLAGLFAAVVGLALRPRAAYSQPMTTSSM